MWLTAMDPQWYSLGEQPTFCDVTTGFPSKWRLRNQFRNPIRWRVTTQIWVMLLISRATRKNLLQPIRSTSQTCVVTRHQYGISALVPQASFHEKTGGGVATFRLFHCFFVWLLMILTEEVRDINILYFFQVLYFPMYLRVMLGEFFTRC